MEIQINKNSPPGCMIGYVFLKKMVKFLMEWDEKEMGLLEKKSCL